MKRNVSVLLRLCQRGSAPRSFWVLIWCWCCCVRFPVVCISIGCQMFMICISHYLDLVFYRHIAVSWYNAHWQNMTAANRRKMVAYWSYISTCSLSLCWRDTAVTQSYDSCRVIVLSKPIFCHIFTLVQSYRRVGKKRGQMWSILDVTTCTMVTHGQFWCDSTLGDQNLWLTSLETDTTLSKRRGFPSGTYCAEGLTLTFKSWHVHAYRIC